MPRNYMKKGGHGGARQGAGRKPAGDNRLIEHYRQRFAITPADYLFAIVNEVDPLTGQPLTGSNRPSASRRDRAAMALAPFVHRRQAPATIDRTEPQLDWDLTCLSDDELVTLEQLMLKVYPTQPPDPTNDIDCKPQSDRARRKRR